MDIGTSKCTIIARFCANLDKRLRFRKENCAPEIYFEDCVITHGLVTLKDARKGGFIAM